MPQSPEQQQAAFRRLNDTIGFDWRLAPYVIEQARAHLAVPAPHGMFDDEDRDQLLAGLAQVERELSDGTFAFTDDENIQAAIERRVTEVVGPVSQRPHTPRPTDADVATAIAMYVRAHASEATRLITDCARELADLADRHIDFPMPTRTDLANLQPAYVSHHLLAYVSMLMRDRRRFEAVIAETGSLPLGEGTRTAFLPVARSLGFYEIAANSIDGISNRDFVLDYLSAAATCSTHLSRLGADIVLWSSNRPSFCDVGDAWTSGSSVTTGKKAPDAAELLRAKSPRVAAHLAALHGVLHALPLTSCNDVHEDMEHLFDAVDTLELSLTAARGMVGSLTFRRELATATADDHSSGAALVAVREELALAHTALSS